MLNILDHESVEHCCAGVGRRTPGGCLEFGFGAEMVSKTIALTISPIGGT
jgi:hypothetical protein